MNPSPDDYKESCVCIVFVLIILYPIVFFNTQYYECPDSNYTMINDNYCIKKELLNGTHFVINEKRTGYFVIISLLLIFCLCLCAYYEFGINKKNRVKLNKTYSELINEDYDETRDETRDEGGSIGASA